MREILFRGKRMDNGEWVEGAYFKHDTVRVCLSSDDPKPKHLIIIDGFCDWGFELGIIGIEVDPATVGQYTGLTDKNGKKIFEGDVVTFKTRSSSFKPCFVRWYEQEVRFLVTMPDGVHSYPMDKSWEYEVIGNVHDNKELLNED